MLKLLKVFLLLNTLICLPAMAGIINTYYENVGDGLAVLDEDTDLIWLDLSQTAGLTQAQALSQYAGFSVATSVQAFNLIANFDDSGDESQRWYGLFGHSEASNYDCTWEIACSYGSSAEGEGFGFGVGSSFWLRADGFLDGAGNSPDAKGNESPISWFLVANRTQLRALQNGGNSASVPEPTTLALLSLALLILSASRRTKKL